MPNNKGPKITVITVSYNAVSIIEKTIKSVINQSYSNIEYIIIDGNSTDGTADIIKKYSDKISYWISEPDKGIYDAMNKGILKSTGEWINFMNCGDFFCNSNVLEEVFCNNEYENTDIIYGNSIVRKNNGTTYKFISGNNIKRMEYGPIYRHGSSFVKSTIHKKYLFDLTKISKINYALDFDVIYRLYKANMKFVKVNHDILNYEEDGISNHPILNRIYIYKITSQYHFSYEKYKYMIKSIYYILKDEFKTKLKSLLFG